MLGPMKCVECGFLLETSSGGRSGVASKLRLDRAPTPVLIEGDARVQALQAISTQPKTPEAYVDAISLVRRLMEGGQTEVEMSPAYARRRKLAG